VAGQHLRRLRQRAADSGNATRGERGDALKHPGGNSGDTAFGGKDQGARPSHPQHAPVAWPGPPVPAGPTPAGSQAPSRGPAGAQPR
jgi:hypothetical protein